MSKHEKAAPVAPAKAAEPTPCAVCGQSEGELETVIGHIRAHAECAARCPEVIAKVKARA